MSRTSGTPISGTKHSPVELYNTSVSSQASSSGGSSIYSTSSSSSRQHLSSGNTSPPGNVSSAVGEQQQHQASKLRFSPANRGIIQQTEDGVSDWPPFQSSTESRSTARGSGGAESSRRAYYKPMIPTATASASGSSSAAPSIDEYHQQTEAGALSSHRFSDERATSNGQRPASKSRRTSSGGSRVPGEGVSHHNGNGPGSSASDSGSDWPHGPKVQTAPHTNPNSPAKVINNDDAMDGERNASGKRPEAASTSSSYFSRAAAAAASQSGDVDGRNAPPRMDLAKYPPQALLRVLAALLAQIAAANDQLRPTGGPSGPTPDSKARQDEQRSTGQESDTSALSAGPSMSSSPRGRGEASDTGSSRRAGQSRTSSPHQPGHTPRPTTAALSALQTPSSTLCFHARNVPSISIESYLLRILKYCPATNEVFLSLLIYFDRMSKMGASASSAPRSASTTSALDLSQSSSSSSSRGEADRSAELGGDEGTDPHAGMRGFAIDSYNVHRLVIAGVTVASKFFSDVFYTNSRYAKVGGLPVHELNQLELQFLLLNDFRLVIPLEEMQRYADQLLVYGGVPRATWTDDDPRQHGDVSMKDA